MVLSFFKKIRHKIFRCQFNLSLNIYQNRWQNSKKKKLKIQLAHHYGESKSTFDPMPALPQPSGRYPAASNYRRVNPAPFPPPSCSPATPSPPSQWALLAIVASALPLPWVHCHRRMPCGHHSPPMCSAYTHVGTQQLHANFFNKICHQIITEKFGIKIILPMSKHKNVVTTISH